MKRFEIHTGVSCSISIRPSLGYTTYTNVPLEDHPCRVHRALKKKHRRFAFPGHAPKPDGKHQETSGNTFSYKMSWPSKFAVHLHCPQKQVLPQTI